MSAVFSPDRLYRYRLDRELAPNLDTQECRVAFIMLNPSTADETHNDPTIRRCIGFAEAWGFWHLTIGNLFAYRATDPRHMKATRDPIGPDNDTHLNAIAEEADLVVCAWGTHGAQVGRASTVACRLHARGVDLHRLGATKDGYPKHPLYLRADLKPEKWTP